jgi:hypothetical protein
MAYDFNMQMNMQAPDGANINRVKKQIEAGLGGINIGGLNTKGFAKANSEIEKTRKNLKKGEQASKSFFDALTGRAANYATFTAISTAVLKLTGAVSQATREAIKYEAELIKISQVTGDTISRTKDYGKELLNISKTYNVNISKIAQLTRTLTQTGLSFREASKGAELLARTSLLASFDNLTSTTEGLIAVMQTFNLSVGSSAKVLEEMNIVSKRFAVESGDIVEAIRRTGGAFSAAGGNVEELIALFTSVRSTSRESAETIATGFRTIFGRLQRPKTIEYFKELGIQLQTAEGQFAGPYEAIKRISEGLETLGIRAGSIQFAQVVEQIGGIRQLSKVVPLLQQFSKSQRALDLQNEASAESTKDVEKAQQGLGFQLGALRQEFGALISEFVDSSSFKFLAETFISIAKTVIRLTSTFKPLLPILATLAAFKIGKGLGSILSGGFSLGGLKNAAVATKGYARGGIVPGSGNGDTVPAMLTPGEFVVRKSATQAFGAANLGKINKYAGGGKIIYDRPEDNIAEETLNPGLAKSVNTLAKSLNPDAKQVRGSIKNIPQYGSVVGVLFEAALSRASDGVFTDSDDPNKPFDFPDGFKNTNFNLIGNGQITSDAKKNQRSASRANILSKIARFLSADKSRGKERDFGVAIMEKGSDTTSNWSLNELGEGKNAGGSISGVGTDTVPSLLTPGEFVVNKKSAQAYGYGNLKNINKYAKGGIVQRFQDGGEVDPRAGRISDLLRATDQGDFRSGIDTSDPKSVQEQIKLLKELAKLAKQSVSAYHPDREDNRPLFDEARTANQIAKERLRQLEEIANDLAGGGGGGAGSSGGGGAGSPGGGGAGSPGGGAGSPGGRATGALVIAKKEEAEAVGSAVMKVEDAASGAGYALIKVEKSGEKAAKANEKAAEASEKLSLNSAQVVFGFAAFTSGLKNFAGVNLNQEALDSAQVKGAKFGGAADVLKQVDATKVKAFNRALFDFGDKLPAKIGKPLKGVAVSTAKYSKEIVAGAGKLAKGLNVAMYAELIGGFVDSLFSQDYGRQKESAIEIGDAQAAGVAALNEYNQSMLRGVPVVGGFLSAIQSFLPVWETSIGGIVKSTAEMQASMVSLDKTMVSSNKKIGDAFIRGDSEEFKKAYSEGTAAFAGTQSKIDASRTKLAGASAGDDALGAAASGAAGGALLGASIGAFGGPVTAAIGGAVGGLIGGVMAYTSSLGKGHEEIMKSYEENGKAVEAFGQAQRDRIVQVSGEMRSAATQVIASGGTYQDAFAQLKDQFGEDAFADIFGDVDISTAADVETAYQKQKVAAEEAAKAVETQNKAISAQANEVDSKWEPAWYNLWMGGKNAAKQAKANLELSKKELEEKKQAAEQRKHEIAQMQQQMAQQSALNKERAIEADRIRAIIELNRSWQKSQEGINNTLSDLSNLSDKFSKIGTGQLTNEDALDGTGISTRTMDMSGEQILRDSDAFDEMMQSINRTAAANNLGTGKQDFLKRTQDERSAIDRLEGILTSGNNSDLTAAILEAKEAARVSTTSEDGKIDKAAAQTESLALKDILIKQLGGGNVSTELEAGLLVYAEQLIGNLDPTVAADAAKKQLGEPAAKFLEEQKENIEKLQNKRQELQDLELQLAAKGVADAKQLYDIQKESSMKMASFIKESQDFFDVDTTTGGRKRSAANNVKFAKEQAGRVDGARQIFNQAQQIIARNVKFSETPKQDLTEGEKVADAIAGEVQDLITDAEKLKRVGPEYLNIINDQIDAEKTKLDALREQATAQREATQALRDAQGDLVNQFAFGTDEQRGDLLKSANATQFAASQGSLAGISGEMRGQVSSFLDQFSDVSLSQFGGKTGAQVKGDLAAEEAVRTGLISRSQKADFAAKAAKKAVPIDQKLADGIKKQEEVIKSLFESEKVLREKQAGLEQENTKEMAKIIGEFRTSVAALEKQLGEDLTTAIANGINAKNKPVSAPAAPAAAQEGGRIAQQLIATKIAKKTAESPAEPKPSTPTGAPREAMALGRSITPGESPTQEIPKFEITGSQQITIAMPDVQAAFSKEITGMVYTTVASVFNAAADQIDSSTSPEGVATALADAANNAKTVPAGGLS